MLATVDPNDEEMVRITASRKVQAEMMPNFINRTAAKFPGLVQQLINEVAAMESQLEAALGENIRAYRSDLGKGADALKVNFCPGLPREVNTGGVGSGTINFGAILGGSHPGEHNPATESAATTAMSRAVELLEIAAAFEPYETGSAKRKVAELFGLKAA